MIKKKFVFGKMIIKIYIIGKHYIIKQTKLQKDVFIFIIVDNKDNFIKYVNNNVINLLNKFLKITKKIKLQ